MISIVFTVLLWTLVAWLLYAAWRRKDGTEKKALKRGWREFLWLLPRLAAGVIGAGFIARLLPDEAVAAHLGPGSGVLGLVIATVAGALTPGGPVVGFSIGTAALKSGAALAPVVAYVTAWSLLALNRVLVWETPYMPRWFVGLRLLVSLPLSFLAGGTVMLLAPLLP